MGKCDQHCIQTNLLRISPIISFSFGLVSFIACLLVLVANFFRKSKKAKTEKEMFVSLTHMSVTCFFINDLLSLFCYLPSQFFQVVFGNYENLSKPNLTLLWVASQLSESLLIASGLWNIVIITCIYLSINAKIEEIDQNTLVEKELLYKSIFVIIAWGIPMLFAFIMCPINIKYQVWYKTAKEFFTAQFLSNGVHSLFYVAICIITFILTIKVFILIRSIPTYHIESSHKKNMILIRLLLYTIPFMIVVFMMTLRRIYTYLTKIDTIINCGWETNVCMDIIGIIFQQIHIVIVPSRGALNSLIYAILSDGCAAFYKRIFKK